MSDKIEACVLCGVVPVQFHEHAPFTKCSTDGCAANSKRLYVIEHWNDRQRLIRAEARIKVLEEALLFCALEDLFVEYENGLFEYKYDEWFGDIARYALGGK